LRFTLLIKKETDIMAGWDGDALAGSMEEALERQQEAAEARRAARQETPTLEDRERKAREESTRLSRARIEEQLTRATNPAHRAMLERALKALEAETTSD
jgi:predicted Holliday junction resolvase-like endonuclease